MRLRPRRLATGLLTAHGSLPTALQGIRLSAGACRVAGGHLLVVVHLRLLHVLVDVLDVLNHVFVDARVAGVLPT